MEKLETVSFDLIEQIRAHINRTEKQAILLKNRQKWDKVTSALRVLEDSAWAIEYYIGNDYPSDIRGKYLFTYGLLQALYIQGDAARSLSVALFDRKIDFGKDYPAANAIREIRNDVAGHPTQRGTSGYIYLVQGSLSKRSFHYIKNDSSSEKSECLSVDVSTAIIDTATCVNAILQNALDNLNVEFKEYIEKHKGTKMKDFFNTLNYAKELVLNHDYLSNSEYASTKNMVKKCEDELILRYGSIDTLDSYKELLAEIHEIYSLIDDGLLQVSSNLRGRFEKYMLQILFSKLEELQELCEETDAYFENYGEERSSPADVAPIIVICNEGFEE